MKKYLLIILMLGMTWGLNCFFETGLLYAEAVKGGELIVARGGESVSLDPAKTTVVGWAEPEKRRLPVSDKSGSAHPTA